MELFLGVLLGWALAASLLAGSRLLRPPRVISGEVRATQQALHAATVTLPHLRRGLSPESAAKTVPHLRTLTHASAVAIAGTERLLAWDGEGADDHGHRELMEGLTRLGADDRLHVESQIACTGHDCPFGAAAIAPLIVQGQRVGSFIALFPQGRHLTPDDTRTVAETGSLVSAQLELAELETQTERLARAELRALRAQISPHFIYNALAAIASYIHSNPEEARELLTDFAEFTRYAFRGESPYVTLADELRYVEKYLRLERARFGDRLEVRIDVAPEVLGAVVPVLSLQPLVENAVRHGVERRGNGHIGIVARDMDFFVELRVIDDGVGIEPARAERLLAGEGGGVGILNVQTRLQGTFGHEYGLQIDTRRGSPGTVVTMTVPKFSPGVRAA